MGKLKDAFFLLQKTVNRRGGTDKQPFEAITDDMR